jgi:ATP sulfurylase
LTPSQIRTIFDTKGWTKVVAFHALSAPTTADEQIIAQACEWCRADGMLVHLVTGSWTGDERASATLLSSYEQLLRQSLPNALLAAFNSYPRHAGPREAVFNALCRKNFGCTHFVIGARDEYDALFYPVSAHRNLFESLGDIGITPVFTNSGEVARSQSTGVDISNTADFRQPLEMQLANSVL